MYRTPENLKQVENLFAHLAPEASRLNRDRLLYEAGKAATPRQFAWPMTTLALAGLSAFLAIQTFSRVPEPMRTVEVVRYIGPNPKAAADTSVPIAESHNNNANTSYLSLRDRMVRFGVDAMPSLPSYSDRVTPLESVERGIAHKS